MPAIVAGSIFSFSLTLGDYIMVQIVGGDTQLFANIIYANVGVAGNLPLAAAATVFPIVVVLLYLRVGPPYRCPGEPMILTRRGRACCGSLVAGASASRSSTSRSIVVVINSFNPAKVFSWPPRGFSTDVVGQGAAQRRRRRRGMDLGRRPASAPPRSRSCSGRWSPSPSCGTRGSGATRSASWSSCRSRCPASSRASRSTRRSAPCSSRSDIPFGLFTVVLGHATFCIVVVFNNVAARLRRTGRTLEEASMDLGADTFTTFRADHVPVDPVSAGRRCVAGLRAVLRRDRGDHVHLGPGHPDVAAVGVQQPVPARTSRRSSTRSPRC